MDFFAGAFGFLMVLSALLVTYHWGVKPDRQAKKRRAEQQLAQVRRRHWENARRRRAA